MKRRSMIGRTAWSRYRPAPMEAPEFASRDLNARSADAARVGRSVFQALDLAAVRLHGSHQHARGAGRRRGDRAHQGNRHQSIAMSLDGNGRYCSLSPREGAKLMVAECCRNLSAVGAMPVAATNNLNFGNPERPEIMAQLVEAIEGIARGLPVLRNADHRRQRQPVQRNAGRSDLADAGDGHRGTDEDGARR